MRLRLSSLGLMIFALATLGVPSQAAEQAMGRSASGRVEIPLEVYQQLLTSATGPDPVGYALGTADVDVIVSAQRDRPTSQVTVRLGLDVLVDEWVLAPMLPLGTPVQSATVDGKAIQLMTTPRGLAWGVNKSGAYAIVLQYLVDAVRSDAGFVAAIPLPEAAATAFEAVIPGSGLDATLIPGTGVVVTSDAHRTTIRATLPATPGVQLMWSAGSGAVQTISRAVYRGELVGDAIQWNADLDVELATDETVNLPLLSSQVTLNDVSVDGNKATVSVEDGLFAARVQGRGTHRIRLAFQVAVNRSEGRQSVSLDIPEIPISRFEVNLPGRKAITVSPATSVVHKIVEDKTLATFHVPMRRALSFSWAEAIPEDMKTEVRAHAQILHAVHAQEGVLYVDATAVIEVSRGELGTIELELPGNVQVERVEAVGGGVSDWRIKSQTGQGRQQLTVFLDHAVDKNLELHVRYERSIVDATASQVDLRRSEIDIPLMRALGVNRQRGMIALLATRELALEPIRSTSLTSVGENQLPAFFRAHIEDTIARTYKYSEAEPSLVVALATPEPTLGKFDAEIDTLISITDVTVKGSASVRVQVKSGAIDALRIGLPKDVNLLSLSAPSLRTHKVISEGDKRFVDVEFTQDMEGHFRVDVAYERIIADKNADLEVPTLSVDGAEVEQGRIAVEALAAVEVQVSVSEQLSSLDPAELPQQLILKTTNPILLAYKYVHSDTPYALVLRMTRHRELAVQGAAIDLAEYRTLFIEDGLAVTTARFEVRNRREQFLRVRLPEDSKVWSVTVDGMHEKPAIADNTGPNGESLPPEILIRVINSAQSFPVELVYATPVSKMGNLGRIRGQLPQPDMIVTRSTWSVFLPDAFRYGTPSSNLSLVISGRIVDRGQLQNEMTLDRASAAAIITGPLRIDVPNSGIQYAFEKLYANQSDEAATFEIAYRSTIGAKLGQSLALAGTLLLWFGLAIALGKIPAFGSREATAASAFGAAALLIAVGYLEGDATPALILALALAIGSAAYLFWLRQKGGLENEVEIEAAS